MDYIEKQAIAERMTWIKEFGCNIAKAYDEINCNDPEHHDLNRENGNINGNTPMGAMLHMGSVAAKEYYLDADVVPPEYARLHREGYIHIHDLDFYGWTTTCTQIDLLKLFQNGFDTGHGHLREPKSIGSYAALAAIAIQSNQNDQHGGQAIVNFDYAMAAGVKLTYEKYYDEAHSILENLRNDSGVTFKLACGHSKWIRNYATEKTRRDTYQAMEGFIHNLNTMHSRAGAQVPFSSINYGMDTSWEGRLAIEQLLLATEAGLGHGETPIFPIQIFRVKEGINYNPGDPNYDLYRLAIRVSAKRLFPNFAFVDAPFNLQYYKPGHPETEIAYMGCRTRVIGNVYDPTREICNQRGNLSFTTINLPRLALDLRDSSNSDIVSAFLNRVSVMTHTVILQLMARFRVQAQRKVKNFPFLMGQGVWLDSEKLNPEDTLETVLKHGTLSVGFIGLAEALKCLIGVHHGESEDAQKLGLRIISMIRSICDAESQKYGMNITCLATPAEGLSGRFVKMDREKYGNIPGVTDKEYYTNSFHVPVYYKIGAYDKIRIEAPYHALTNGGHITYIEMDGDPTKNLDAFEIVIRCMHDNGIGYGSINHPVDRDPVCGYTGIINDTCPKCGRIEGDVPFERIRRITGYLVGNMSKWNDAKRAEERDRVKHL